VRAAARPLGFVRRAEAAENLGVIRHRPSWPRLVAALSDPHISVRSVAARSLAAISEPESFCQLAKRLRSAALELVPEISPWILKMALASFPLAEATKLREFLEDPCRPLRSLTAEVVAAMVEHEAAVCAREHRRASCLDPGLIELFLTRLASDHDPEVRARAADIAARVEDTRSLPVLNALANDPEWVVRLHAIRALGRQRLSSLQEISRHLTDRNWRVREAAVQVLSARGPAGIQRLVDHFLTAEDRYSKEQIAEQIGKTGLIRSFVEGFGSPGHESERRFIEGMIRIGKGDAILAAVGNGTRRRRSSILRQALASSPDLAIRAFAEQLAAGHENRGASENWSLDASKLAARSPV